MASEAALLPYLVALATVSALIYILLGRRLGRRKVSSEAALANHAWQAWWILLAASTLVGTVMTSILGVLDAYSLPIALTVMMVNLLLVFGALWGLSYYLAYVVFGRVGLWNPIAWFYGTSVVAWFYTIFAAQPIGTQIVDGQAALLYATALEDQPLYPALLAALLLPILAAAGAYLYLGLKADDRTVRFRIILVSFSLIIWFGISLIATATALADLPGWPVVSRFISLGAAIMIYVAHFPPKALADKLGLRPAAEED